MVEEAEEEVGEHAVVEEEVGGEEEAQLLLRLD